MRRIVILIILVFSNILFVKPQSSPLLKYNPSNEVYEYAQLTFTVEDAKVGKPINMVFTNGVQYENITKEFKNYVELYNFIGRIGWSFLTENKSIEKNKTKK